MQQKKTDLPNSIYLPHVVAETFSPSGLTTKIEVDTTSSVPQAVMQGGVVRFSNSSNHPIAIAFGNSSVVAEEATAFDILQNTAELVTVPNGSTHFAAIVSTGAHTLKYTVVKAT